MRFFDFLISLMLLVIFFIPIVLVTILVKLTSKGPAVYWSERVGRDNKIFKMPKFRSMRVDTPQVATHLLSEKDYLTPVGSFIRKTSLDELPQIYSVLVGDMAIVGPRPALFNQDDLISLRTEKGVHKLRPGITGWAQINGRDEISIPQKVELDAYYVKNKNILFDIKIIVLTAMKVLLRKDISH